MINKALKLALGILLLLVVLVMGMVGGGYLYLKPENEPPHLASQNTVRVVENGELIGFESQNDTYAWLGIPYAAPPVGELRWKAPRPPERWTGRFEALEFGPICSQTGWDVFSGEMGTDCSGSEDCLSLNIWAPADKNGNGPVDQSQFPVMVWIHGGGNMIGHGNRLIYNGAQMAGKHDVVVVTINYRLGPFGWFTHPALRSEEASPEDNSGNYGTLDIIQALKWVQNNIIVFGGDPGNVTIYGESAGGGNVLSMMASPLAEGLFHQAISQSADFKIIPVSLAENYLDDEFKGEEVSSKEIVNNLLVNDGLAADRDAAKKLQENEPAEKIATYLYGKSPEEIFAAYQIDGGIEWFPNLFGDGYVLPKDMTIAEIFSDIGNYNSVPVILGSNRDETKLFMMLDDELVDKAFGLLPVGFTDDFAYETINRYDSELWKIRCVDSLAGLMRKVQGERVFAYRFDAKFLSETGFRNQKAYCDTYKSLFRGDDFVQSEYENLGNRGCTE